MVNNTSMRDSNYSKSFESNLCVYLCVSIYMHVMFLPLANNNST